MNFTENMDMKNNERIYRYNGEMVNMIDLHTHTKYSDGSYEVKDVLKQAEETGVTILSITDHDKVDAHIEIENMDVKKYYTGKVITGAEFSASFEGKRLELLGYDIDIHVAKEWLDKTYTKEKMQQDNINEFNYIYDLCIRKGIKMTHNLSYDLLKYPVDQIYYDIVRYEENRKFFEDNEWNNIEVFWRKCSTDKNFILYWDFSIRVPDAKEVSEVIRKSGGKVFLAHLYKYRFENHEEVLKRLAKQNIIDGVEVYYYAFTDKQTEYLKDYCEQNNLYMSAGSDFHGAKKPERKIGVGFGNMNAPESIIENWIK